MRTRRRFGEGFALIELLMAAVVAACAAALLAGALTAANRSTDIRVSQVLSTQALASRLALLDDTISPDAPTSRAVLATPAGYAVTLQLADAQPPLAPLVQTTLREAHRGSSADVVTYRRQPEEQPPAP